MRASFCYIEDNATASENVKKALSVCLLEDNYIASDNFERLLSSGENAVYVTDDFRDLADWITDDPNRFDVILMDLKVPSRSLRILESCKDYDDEIDHSPTLYFIERFLLPNFPECEGKLILLSAYLDYFRAKGHGEQLDRFLTVSKDDPNVTNILPSKINEILKKKNAEN